MSNKFELESEKYEKVLYVKGGIIVKKNGLYGVINKIDGKEIIPCNYSEYLDVYNKWEKMGFTTKKVELSTEQRAAEIKKQFLEDERNKLVSEGHIRRISFYEGRTVNGATLVKLPNGQTGLAGSVIAYDYERDKNLEILDENGEHLMFISEPELQKGAGTPHLVMCSDEENIYVGSYGNDFSYLAAYKMGDFSKKWKTPKYGSRIQSVDVNDKYLIAFDMNDGKIKYFDKTTGQHIENKDIDTKTQTDEWTITSQHNLATTNENLIAAVPGLRIGIEMGTLEFNNELKVYDNDSTRKVAQTSFSIDAGTLNAVAVDTKRGRAYLAIGNKIGIFDSNGYIGMIPQTTGNIKKLNFDQQTGCLMVSMKEGKGKVELLDTEAIERMIEATGRVIRGDIPSERLGLEAMDILAKTTVIDETNVNINGHMNNRTPKKDEK